MVTFEDIKTANESIKTTPIKGKLYAEVNQRIKAFRMVYPAGAILTEMVLNENGICVFRASVCSEDGVILGQGTAYEKEGSSFINEISYIENCETSAVGRALGMAGFGIDTSVASAEEVQNAEIQQAENEKIDALKVKSLRRRCKEDNVDVKSLCELYKVKSFEELTMKKFMNIHEHWDKIVRGEKA